MAEVADLSAIMSLEEELTCSICLCPFVCPVTIPCGHNFCQDCLLTTWKDSYSCPQCRTHFATKPELKKNTVLSTVVETFMRSSMKSDPGPTTEEEEETETAVKEEPKPPAVMCDTCMEVKAVNTCLTCMASFCEQHVKPHRENPIFGSHQLGEPLLDLRERICPDHHKLMEFFCAEHGRCICGYCLQQAHKGCRFSTPDEQRALQESDMRTKLSLLDRKIGRNQSVLCQTQELQNKLKESVSSRKQFLESEYRQIRELLEREEREAANAVDREQENCQAKLQTHVKNFDKNVEKLSGARDRINDLLGRSQSLAFLQASVDLPSQANFDPYTPKINLDSQAVIASQTFTVALKEFLLHIMRQPVEARLQILRPDPSRIPPNNPHAAKSETYTVPLCGYPPEMFGVPVGPPRHFRSPSPGAALRAGQRKPRSDKKADQKDKHNKKPTHGPRESPIPPKPKEHPKGSSEEPGNQKKADPQKIPPNITAAAKRCELLQYGAVFTLDVKTAHRRISLSENFTKATVSDETSPYPDGPARFAVCTQVLGCKGFSRGRHYWEVKTSSNNFVGIGLAYNSIDRKGPASRLGRNAQSWCVEWFNVKLSAWHASAERVLFNPGPSRVGVLLDCDEGAATFYNVADRAYPFHTFVFPFAEAVYPAFWVFSNGSTVSLCKLQ